MPDNLENSDLDQALSRRLSRLSTQPGESAALRRKLEAELADMTDAPAGRGGWRFPVFTRSALAMAAALLLVATLALLFFNFGSTPALAAPADLAQLHTHMNHPGAQAMPVSTVADANRILAGQWEDIPALPSAQFAQLHACCIHDFMDKKVAILLLRADEASLTLVIGKAREFRPTQGRAVTLAGRTFYLHEVNGLQMVMFQDQDRYVCLMGQTTSDRLLEIARGLGS